MGTRATKTQAALFDAPGSPFRTTDVETPEPAQGEVLVRIEHATVCGSDVHTVLGRRVEPTPTVLGHEAIGIVEQLGSNPPDKMCGAPIDVGDRVTWSVASSCGRCERCDNGLPQKCFDLLKYGHCKAEERDILTGGFAERILLKPGTAIVGIGDLPWQLACPLNCATATVAAALKENLDLTEKRVLILGAGMLGVTAVAMCHQRSAKTLCVLDKSSDRLETAREFGATETIQVSANSNETSTTQPGSQLLSDHEFDLIVELTGDSALTQHCIRHAAIGGSIVLVGAVTPVEPVSLDPQQFVRRCLRMRGVHNYGPTDLFDAVTFMQDYGHNYPFGTLVGSVFPLREIDSAFKEAIRGEVLRVAIQPWSEP